MKTTRFFLIVATMLPAAVDAGETRPFDRRIGKEPTYQTVPKYCLLTFGKEGDVKVWMVEDGRRLFVDKNANGDLTDDGPPIKPSNLRNPDAQRWDFNYVLDAIAPADGARHTHFNLACWSYRAGDVSYGLAVTVDDRVPMYAGWFGTFWSADREKAPVIHFGGAFTPKLMRRTDFQLGEKGKELNFCFWNFGSRPGAEARLSIEALPRFVTPVVNIEWPIAPGAAPLRTSHRLTERCCNWEFYTKSFAIPKDAAPGNARLSFEFPADTMPVELTTKELTAPVVAAAKP